jgi:hypothetical protein
MNVDLKPINLGRPGWRPQNSGTVGVAAKRDGEPLRRPQWDSGQMLALANAGVFWLASFFTVLTVPGVIELQQWIAILFAVGSAVTFYKLITASVLDATAFYVFGTGLFFGFGTFYSTITNHFGFWTPFDRSIQEEYLCKINFMNSTSVFIVIATASLLRRTQNTRARTCGIETIFDVLLRVRFIVLIVAAAVLLMLFVTFPRAENLLLRGALAKLYGSIPLAVMLMVSYRRSVSIYLLLASLALAFGGSYLGFLFLSKTEVMFPLIGINLGLFFGNKSSRRFAVAAGLVTVLFYYFVVSPVVTEGRNIPGYNEMSDTIEVRAQLINELLFNQFDPQAVPVVILGDQDVLIRFSEAHIQYFLMHQYDERLPGHSLSSWWVAMVPRIMWPDKPNVTRFGSELNQLVFFNDASSLAPSYTGEAYWNYGWAGVVLISIMIGLEIGWLSRKWRAFMSGESRELGIVVVMVPVALFSFWVESWIASTYIGGFVTLVALIKAVDFWKVPRRAKRENL